MTTLLKRIFNPQFDELSLYAISYCFLLGVIFNFKGFILFFFPDHTSEEVPLIAFALLSTFSLMILNFYHAFSNRNKWHFEKSLILLFAVISQGLLAILASIPIFFMNNIWLYPFPLINLIYGFGILSCARSGLYKEEDIKDTNIDRKSIIISTIIITIIFLICRYYFSYIFIITYSICISTNMFLMSTFQPLLLKSKVLMHN